ncbi:MAG: hypothetical protein HY764_04200 [Candidatus Portnoybacteria bacterium]|nr:hypothetical protein [Candidatus Portnoybacteria bacterium]
MSVELRITKHAITGVNIVEVLVDGNVAGIIYPNGQKAIKIISAHIKDTEVEDKFFGTLIEDKGEKEWPPIPAVRISFEPSPYTIIGRKIIKL